MEVMAKSIHYNCFISIGCCIFILCMLNFVTQLIIIKCNALGNKVNQHNNYYCLVLKCFCHCQNLLFITHNSLNQPQIKQHTCAHAWHEIRTCKISTYMINRNYCVCSQTAFLTQVLYV